MSMQALSKCSGTTAADHNVISDRCGDKNWFPSKVTSIFMSANPNNHNSSHMSAYITSFCHLQASGTCSFVSIATAKYMFNTTLTWLHNSMKG